MLIQCPTFKLIYKSSTFYYCSDAICDNSLYQKALEHASYAFFFLLFLGGRRLLGEWGRGEGTEVVLGNTLYFCLTSYINNDISDKLILFSYSKRTRTLQFKLLEFLHNPFLHTLPAEYCLAPDIFLDCHLMRNSTWNQSIRLTLLHV